MPNAPVPAAGEAMPAVRLSDLFADPFLRRAFRRGQGDQGAAFTVPGDRPRPKLAGGAAAPRKGLEAIDA